MTKYFLKRAVSGFDLVDQEVYQNWSKALDKDDKPLYSGVGFEHTPKGPVFMGSPTWIEFSMMIRIMGVKGLDGIVPGGSYQEPEFIRLRLKGKKKIHEIQHEVQS